jgi:hypothetical protein
MPAAENENRNFYGHGDAVPGACWDAMIGNAMIGDGEFGSFHALGSRDATPLPLSAGVFYAGVFTSYEKIHSYRRILSPLLLSFSHISHI